MEHDAYGGVHATTSHEAVAAFGDATLEFLRHGRGTLEQLDRATEIDPHLVSAHALRGHAFLLLARPEYRAMARACHAQCLAHGAPLGRFETSMIQSLELALAGRQRAAADLLDSVNDPVPTSLIALKLAHQIRFLIGDLEGMFQASRRFHEAGASGPGASFASGCYAFALEEMGEYGKAEVIGRAAVAADSKDMWGGHAVAHVYEMTVQPETGIEWSNACRANALHCNNFGYHLEWHHALFLLELGKIDAVLEHYDSAIRPEPTDDFRDVANAASLLSRLVDEGIDVGDRWIELRHLAGRRSRDEELVFAALHNLLILLACDDPLGAQSVVQSLEAMEREGASDQSSVARRVGVPLARCLVDLSRGKAVSDRELLRLCGTLRDIGGSNAQRDVFIRSLMVQLSKVGDWSLQSQLYGIRRQLAADSRGLRAALEHSGGRPQA